MAPKESFEGLVERLNSKAWHRPYHAISERMRNRRGEFFESLLATLPRPIRLLVIDGPDGPWAQRFPNASDAEIVILNVRPEDSEYAHIEMVLGDARYMPEFADDEFDLVYANSVIEHVGGLHDQRNMAEEVRRVGRHHFIQTPNYWFPIEPHFLAPGFQYWPRRLRAWSITKWDLGPYGTGTFDMDGAYECIDEVRLLRRRELESLFPGSVLWEEKVLGLVKSFVACGGWDSTVVKDAAGRASARLSTRTAAG